MHTVLITGGTGMIGTALSRHLLNEGYNVIILSRNPRETAANHAFGTEQNFFRSSGKLFYARWDVNKMTIDHSALKEADYVVHLAGAGVADKRWSDSRKKEILESRTRSSALLLKCLKENPNKVTSSPPQQQLQFIVHHIQSYYELHSTFTGVLG
jgi:NAD dependent epimerase/dehydratase family enzyme